MTEDKPKYKGRGGYHGGGRKPKADDQKRCSMNISAKKEILDAIRQKAKEQGKTTSQYIIDCCLNTK